MLVVSPAGKHFGIEVKGQSTKNFWRFNDRAPHHEMYYASVFVPREGTPRVFIMNSGTTISLRVELQLWKEYKNNATKKGAKEDNMSILCKIF